MIACMWLLSWQVAPPDPLGIGLALTAACGVGCVVVAVRKLAKQASCAAHDSRAAETQQHCTIAPHTVPWVRMLLHQEL